MAEAGRCGRWHELRVSSASESACACACVLSDWEWRWRRRALRVQGWPLAVRVQRVIRCLPCTGVAAAAAACA